MSSKTGHGPARHLTAARREATTGAILVASVLLLVPHAARLLGLTSDVGVADNVLAATLCLNLALVLFGWRRYRDLTREVEVRTAAEERAQTLALRDPLTGFHNRRALIEHGGAELARAARRGKVMALALIDLDRFKNINDVHGHQVGDQFLCAVAEALRAALPPNAIAARIGGDEFACAFLFDADQPRVADAVAERIVTNLAEPVDLPGVRLQSGASVGIARSDEDNGSIDALLRRADIAMYAAKKAGRGRFAWFDASMERELQARTRIETGLRTAIPAGQIVPYYEQQVDLSTGRLIGFEVLARWEHPTDGIIEPDTFIPVAEECGLIGDLSMSVMRQAFEQARGWDPSLSLSCNVSPAQLRDPWLAQKILKLLTETGFPPSRLEIELTESALFENLGLAQATVGSLKNQGIRIALDDFGTGYSSLAHLRALPFDRIKIDKSFVLSMVDNQESAAIVDAIARLGDSLNLPITAEGVETSGIEERLRALGLRKGQGWLFGKPMPVAAARTLLAERALIPTARTDPEPARKAG
ncbi:putative bifunctional diguanylate cyclase/phosphodiesterase [Sphingomonas jatrophae]|uniref:Diguanylate cyclase/phosphodiesterase n=1 Tax=Sphingomonas jatrophae TaxID=1166337 RepID=A0A1I6JYG5_9SPHN|nr:EAL domain-containing protein [Sphingomonas jatrophae]SFR84004.1 diguanylate cyclase/phosphodiesterase [Sphingomonas jatrophae]